MPNSGSGTGTPLIVPAASLEAQPYFTAVWVWNNGTGTWTDRTLEARTAGGTAFSILAAAADYVYLGSESRFDMGIFLLSVVGSLGALTYAYSRADNTWSQTVPVLAYDFTLDGAEQFTNLRNWASRSFSATSPHAATPPDTTSRYWLRISTASVTTTPTVNQIQMRPRAYYCTPSDVANLLQLDDDFDATTVPSRNTVEDYIYAAQSYIDYRTHKSWRFNVKNSEEHQFNLNGIRLLERDIQRITRVQVYNGSEYETKTQGRTGDYFFVADTGMLYWARYFLLPARLQSYNAPVWQWGLGEFNFPVRVSYIYGKDIITDNEQGPLVFDITRKRAAIDVYRSHDYSILASSGSDRVSLDNKIRGWTDEIEEYIERLTGWLVV